MNATTVTRIVVAETVETVTHDELCRLAGVEPGWVRTHLEAGSLQPLADDSARFTFTCVQRVMRLRQLERDFDAVPELAALVADLEAEVRRLKRGGWR